MALALSVVLWCAGCHTWHSVGSLSAPAPSYGFKEYDGQNRYQVLDMISNLNRVTTSEETRVVTHASLARLVGEAGVASISGGGEASGSQATSYAVTYVTFSYLPVPALRALNGDPEILAELRKYGSAARIVLSNKVALSRAMVSARAANVEARLEFDADGQLSLMAGSQGSETLLSETPMVVGYAMHQLVWSSDMSRIERINEDVAYWPN